MIDSRQQGQLFHALLGTVVAVYSEETYFEAYSGINIIADVTPDEV
jgi:hypothetical protein